MSQRPADPGQDDGVLDQGMLDVGDGHRLHWELSGNPGGKPAVVLHGGPGSGSTPWSRRWFDPRVYLVVQLDQRAAAAARRTRGRPPST